MKLAELINVFQKHWPESAADDWDRVGLSIGSLESQIESVLVSVDVTPAVIEEAIQKNCQLILSHHPMLLKPVSNLNEGNLKGDLVSKLIRSNIALYSAHTNADLQKTGASNILAKSFGLKKLKPLVASSSGFGHGCIGELDQEISLKAFAKTVSTKIPVTARGVALAGNPKQMVRRVAVCSGAGDSFIPAAIQAGADVFVTSDLRHHLTQDATFDISLIDISHWAAESVWVTEAVKGLGKSTKLRFIQSELNTDPWIEVL